MTLYARADVMHVSVPLANGGCGEPHSRPVHHGAPDKDWGLTCPKCETFLKQDVERSGAKKIRTVNSDNGLKLAERYLGLWGTRVEMVPETYDQEIDREHNEQETARNQASNSTEAFRQIGDAITSLASQGQGNTALVQALAKALAGASPEPEAPVAEPEPAAPVPLPVAECQECGDVFTRTSNKGPAPKRCPACKSKAAA
jgi:rubrerythrin